MDMDSCPVGGGAGSKPFSGAASPEDDFRSCSVSELVVHNNWKARKEGYERIQKDPVAHKKTLLGALKPLAAEGNATVQEAAIDAMSAVLPQCDEAERLQLAEGVLPMIVEKGITGRPKAAQASQAFVSALVEDACIKPVFTVALPAFAHRSPKNKLAAAQLTASLVADYGVQHFPIKEILKAMQPLFNDSNVQVRKEAAVLCCQCYRYIGASIKGFLTDLRDVQLQELQKQFEQVSVGQAPPKTIKVLSAFGDSRGSKKESSGVVKPIASLTGDDAAGVVDDAGFQLLDEAPVIPRLPKKFFRMALDKETSWQTRVDYVNEHLMPLLAAPRLRAKDDYHELAGMMKEYLVDPQAPLMLLGFKMIQECARGLRSDFAVHAKAYVPPLLDKLKDKKVSVQLHVMKTLEDLISFNCVTMDQCHEDIDQALQSKNPTQRMAIVNFCIHMVDALGDKSRYVRLGRSTAMLSRLVKDEKPSIRDISYVLLDRLIQAFGEAQYKSVLATLDDNQRNNMAAAVARGAPGVGPRQTGSRTASNLPTPHGSVVPGATPSNSPAKKIPRLDDAVVSAPASSSGLAGRTRTASAGGALPAARRLSTAVGDGGGGDGTSRVSSSAPRDHAASASSPFGRPSITGRGAPSRNGGSGGDAVTPSRSAVEDGIALESSLPPKMESVTMVLGFLDGDNAVLDMVRSTEWSRRQEGVAKLLAMVQGWTPVQAARGVNYLVVYMRAHPSFREPIFQVFSLIAQVFQEAVGKVATLSPGAGYALVSGFTPRLSDAKNKPLVRDICELIAQKLGRRFVVRHMLDTAAMAKTPKLIQEVCEYVREALQRQSDNEEAEADAVDVRSVLHFVRVACADVNNAGVRQETVQLLVELRRTPRGAAAVERCVASLPTPLPAMYEREVNKPETSRANTAANGVPLPPSRAITPAAGAAAAPATAPGKRVRTSSQSPGPGTRGRLSAPSPVKPPSAHRRTTSVDVDGPLSRASATTPSGAAGGTASSPQSRLSTARTSSAGPSPRSSFATAAVAPAALRPILQEITSGEDWRDRLAGVRHAEAFVEESPRPLPANCVAPLLKALQSRFEEANKNVVVDVLRFIPVVVGAAGKEECGAALRKLAPGVLGMLGDQKTALREEARNVAFLVMRVVGLEAMLPLLQKPLGSESNVCRQNVLEMMVSGFEQMAPEATLPRAGMQLLTPAVINSMMDRILEVRVIAEQVLGWMVGVVGEDFVLQCVQRLKPAEQQVVMPAVERQLEHQRHSAAELDQSRAEPSPFSATLNATTNSLYDNEESHKTTPRVTTPRASAGTSSRAAHGLAETPHRRASVTNPRDNESSPRPAQKHRDSSVTQLSPAVLEQAAAASTGAVHTASGATATSARKTASPATVEHAGKLTTVAPPAKGEAAPAQTTRAKTPTKGTAGAKAPATESTPGCGAHAAQREQSDKRDMYTIREILVGLRSATPGVAQTMCEDFTRHLRAGVDCGSPEVIQAMVERLYENTQNFDANLAKALIDALNAMFAAPQCAARCHSQLLERITGVFFDCLLSEKFSLQETVIKALNAMTLKMLEGCRADDVFGALLNRLTGYSTAYLASGHKSDLKYIQVTVKCIMRVDLSKVSADTTVLHCHEYLLQHPPSAFRNLDDVPIRTVKTILQSATKRHGASLLSTAERLVGPENLVTHFIRACLDMQAKAAKDKGLNEQQVIEESREEQRASLSPAPPVKEAVTAAAAAAPVPSTPAGPSSSAGASSTPVRRTATTTTPRKKRPSGHADPHVTIKAPPPPSSGGGASASANTTAAPAATKATSSVTLLPPATTTTTAAVAAAATSSGASNAGSSAVTRALSPPAPAAARKTPVKAHPRHATTATSTPNHSGRGSGTTAQTSPVPSTLHETPRPAATPPATTPTKVSSTQVDVTKELTEIFGHIRNHVSSASGIDELYGFLKTTAPSRYEDAFRLQFNRCSEAFRLYIKRKLERKVEEDSAKPATFQLPAVIQNLS